MAAETMFDFTPWLPTTTRTIIMFASNANQLQAKVVLPKAPTPILVGRGREIKRRDDQTLGLLE